MARKPLLLALLLALLSPALPLGAVSLDLGDSILYVRKGFDRDAISEGALLGSAGWYAFKPQKDASLALRDLGLEGYVRPAAFEATGRPPESFTIALVFNANLSLMNTAGLSLLVPQAGQGWRLYLNGVLIQDELHVGDGGVLSPERCLKNVIIPVDKRNLRTGRNILAFHVYGDPGDERTGLPGKRSLRLGPYAELNREASEYLDIVLIGVFALFALYHFILFALRPKGRANLIYSLAAVIFSAFLFSRSSAVTALIPDTALIRSIEFGCLFIVVPIFIAFCEAVIGRRSSAVTWAGLALGAFLVLAGLLKVMRFEALRYVWEILSGLELLYLFAFMLLPRVFGIVRGEPGKERPSWLRVILSDSGLLFVASLVFSAGALADVLAVNSGGDMSFTKYTFLIFVLGAAAILASQFTSVYGEVAEQRSSLERKVAQRSAELAQAMERQREIGLEIEEQGRRLKHARDAAERDLEIAERVQRGIFPAEAPKVDGWDLSLLFRPASGVSGDFFDFYVAGDKLSGLALGDVSGHGIGAGLISVLARSTFARRYNESRRSLGDLLALLQGDLEGELGGVDEYLTCLILRFEGAKVEYANAAHPDLLYWKADSGKALPVLPRGSGDFKGPPLGKTGFEGRWTGIRFSPDPGDCLLAYTDCLEEARGPSGERYGRERLLGSFAAASSREVAAEAILADLVSDLEAFTGGSRLDDDLTAIVLKRQA